MTMSVTAYAGKNANWREMFSFRENFLDCFVCADAKLPPPAKYQASNRKDRRTWSPWNFCERKRSLRWRGQMDVVCDVKKGAR